MTGTQSYSKMMTGAVDHFMTPSPEQEAICNHVSGSAANLVVEASPGSGKTTTIGLAARGLPMGKLYVALAFAKANAEDFQRKLPHFVQASTCHSLCKRAIDAAARGKAPKVAADKVKLIIKDNYDLPWEVAAPTIRLVSLLKQQVEDLPEDEVEDMALSYGIDIEDSRVIPTSVEVLARSDEDLSHIDFDDMLRFAARLPYITFPTFGLIFVDEAQDTNAVQRSLLRKLACRIVAVGDPYQSIYGFRGADSNALTRIREDFHADVLPLSVSYRCSQKVVAEAQRILADSRFGPSREARVGTVKSHWSSDEPSIQQLAKQDPREVYFDIEQEIL